MVPGADMARAKWFLFFLFFLLFLADSTPPMIMFLFLFHLTLFGF
jgi:hypothetical protein